MRVLRLWVFLRGFFGVLVMAIDKILKQGSDIKSWFLLFGCFPTILGLFWISFKVLHFNSHGWDLNHLMQFLCGFRGRFGNLRGGFWLKTSVVEIWDSKAVRTCRNRRLNWLKNKNGFLFSLLNFKWGVDLDGDVEIEEKDDVYNEEEESDSEDGEFDVEKLRRLVKIERKNKKKALVELEKEKVAAAGAAEEAMAMIYRLQREKREIEIKADQFRRMMELKHQYDQEVIDYLQWFIMEEYDHLEGSFSEQPLTVGDDGASRFQCDMEFVLEDDDDDAQMNNID